MTHSCMSVHFTKAPGPEVQQVFKHSPRYKDQVVKGHSKARSSKTKAPFAFPKAGTAQEGWLFLIGLARGATFFFICTKAPFVMKAL